MRVLTGIQSSGKPHLGNIVGAIMPAIKLSAGNNANFFIADLHSLTNLDNAKHIKENTFDVACAWLACGVDTGKHLFYRQSDVPEVCELAWYLNCIAPVPMMSNMHAFKYGQQTKSNMSVGTFCYPILMAADILLYKASVVPVGNDQLQHVEIVRDVALKFNSMFGQVFVVPAARLSDDVKTIRGTDGRKMSKSYNNIVAPLEPDMDKLKKQVYSIVTDSKSVEEPKNPESCNVFSMLRATYGAMASETAQIESNYLNGGMGYGEAKKILLESIISRFEKERKLYVEYRNNPDIVETLLNDGAVRARQIAKKTLSEVRQALGFK